MTPAATVKDELEVGGLYFLYIEGTAVEMGLAQCTTNLQFLANGEGTLGAYELEAPDATTLTAVQRNHIDDIAQVELGLAMNQL